MATDKIMSVLTLVGDEIQRLPHWQDTDHDLLFVLADAMTEEDASALIAHKKRLAQAGKDPFFICSCHRDKVDALPVGLFDLTAICGHDRDMLPGFPAGVIRCLLHGDMVPLERQELLDVLRRPGQLLCFARASIWSAEERQDMTRLCRELTQDVAAAQARFGELTRFFVYVTVTDDAYMDTLLTAMEPLTEGHPWRSSFIFQGKTLPATDHGSIVLWGMMGV